MMLSYKEFKDLPGTAKYDVYTALFSDIDFANHRIVQLTDDLDYVLSRYVSLQKKYDEYRSLVRKLL